MQFDGIKATTLFFVIKTNLTIPSLPDNVTQTFVFLLSSSIPDIYLHPGLLANMVPTGEVFR